MKFQKYLKKLQFFKEVSPWFLSKNRPFYHVCFFGKPRKKRSLFNILERKEYFLDQKSVVEKDVRKIVFLEGVGPCFLSKKLSVLPSGFFRRTKAEKIVFFFNILDKKEYFLDLKSELSKIS